MPIALRPYYFMEQNTSTPHLAPSNTSFLMAPVGPYNQAQNTETSSISHEKSQVLDKDENSKAALHKIPLVERIVFFFI